MKGENDRDENSSPARPPKDREIPAVRFSRSINALAHKPFSTLVHLFLGFCYVTYVHMSLFEDVIFGTICSGTLTFFLVRAFAELSIRNHIAKPSIRNYIASTMNMVGDKFP